MPREAYFYNLPLNRIAQRPVHPSHDAKMLVVDRKHGKFYDTTFLNLASYLNPKDLIVFNNTKVIPARFFGCFEGSEAEVEVLLTKQVEHERWHCIVKPMRRFRFGRVLRFGVSLSGRVGERVSDKEVEIAFFCEDSKNTVDDLMRNQGLMPIPPYIRKGHADKEDQIDYQTIFAEIDGSIAAPTASLHFTDELMRRINEKGCEVDFLTLHVGTSSFLPLEAGPNGSFVPPGEESFNVSNELLERINRVKSKAGRVIGIGTTVIRALETAMKENTSGVTNLFIRTGFKFRAVDAVITNFHQPGTTHLQLVEALLGRSLLDKAYTYALEHEYRFLSYGDGMFIA